MKNKLTTGRYRISNLTAQQAYKNPDFASIRDTYIKPDKDGELAWNLKRVNIPMQVLLLNYHFPLSQQDSRHYLYDAKLGKDVELANQDIINTYVQIIRDSYGFTANAIPSIKDLGRADSLSTKTAVFEKWDGTPRLFSVLDDFFELNPNAIVLSEELNEESIKGQMRLAFAVWLLQYVARRKGLGQQNNGDIQYGVMPLIVSADKGIGKSSFLSHVLSPTGNTRTATLTELLDPLTQGRLFAHNMGLILDELSPFDLKRNLDRFKEVVTSNTYRVEEKFQQATGEILRETALAASSNRSVDSFSFYENDRRMQVIAVSKKENPQDFADYPFAQLTAEASAIIDSFDDRRELKKLLRWGIDDTLQIDGDDVANIYDFLSFFTSDVFDDYQNQNSEHVYESSKINQPGLFVPTAAIKTAFDRYDAVRAREILAQLGLKSSEVKRTGDGESWDITTKLLTSRLRTYLEDFMSKSRGKISNKRSRNTRGYLITDPVKTPIHKSELDTSSLSKRWHRLKEFYDSDKRYEPLLVRQLAGAKAWGDDLTSLNLENLEIETTLNLSGFENRLVVLETEFADMVPDELAQETFTRDNQEWTRVFFYLSQTNMRALSYSGTFDTLKEGAIQISQNQAAKDVFVTKPTWIEDIQENQGIGFLMYMANYRQIL